MGENIKEVRLAASSLYTHSIISLFVAEMSRLIEVTLIKYLSHEMASSIEFPAGINLNLMLYQVNFYKASQDFFLVFASIESEIFALRNSKFLP